MPLNKIVLTVLSISRPLKRLIVLWVDFQLCFFSVSIAFFLRTDEWVPYLSNGEWSPGLAAFASAIIALPIFLGLGLYREIFRYSEWTALFTVLKAMSLYGILYFVVFSLIGVKGVPRTIGVLQPIILLILVGSSRTIASYFLSNAYRVELRLAQIPRVLIYGAGNAGRQLAGALTQSYEMQVVGFLDDDEKMHGQILFGKKIYDPKNLALLVQELNVAKVLLAIPSANRFRRNQIINTSKVAKVSIQTLPSFMELAHGKVSIQDLRFLDIDDLLSREVIQPNTELLSDSIQGKIVAVTGAGGSIGSELCRQIISQLPTVLVLIEQSEVALYQIHLDLIDKLKILDGTITIVPILANVANVNRLHSVIEKYKPHTIYHAAAYKHVPLVESNPIDGVYNNVIGTLAIAKIAINLQVSKFVLISTDKAVRPTNIMGASKRVSEMILQSLSDLQSKTCFSMVRFGNVLNSSGSVVPKFHQQIKDGGPVTITDCRITRYFMTIPEAAQLVIQAGELASGGDVFLLDMGEPIKIIDLAYRMIELSGLEVRDANNPNGDIEIKEIGLRPGEKLYEELLISGAFENTNHPRIFKSHENYLGWEILEPKLLELQKAIDTNDENSVIHIVKSLVPEFLTQ